MNPEGLRGRTIIFVRLHFSGPRRIHTEIKDCPDTSYVTSHFTRNLATIMTEIDQWQHTEGE
jgi:hypothetical protein